ncbi:MAG TPA: hypothetical protein VGX92_13920 [Pyrinomonadaceae bacterium]|jgi:hypothetical protein|nr:hypothetical protein [Pyrinomonadaceae bacterium]
MATVADIENKLAGVAFQPGQGGLIVSAVDDGFLIQNVNQHLEPLRLTEPQIAAVIKAFPKLSAGMLERFLVRNTETSRRALMLEERTKSPIYSHFQSLDPERPMPAPGSVDASQARKIPRVYSALDLSEPSKPTLALWGSELGAANTRLDEAMFLCDISPEDAKLIQNGADPRLVLKGKTVENVRAVYYDDNKVITGMKRLEHHMKSLESLENWIQKAVGDLKVLVSGNIFTHVEDDFLDPPAISLIETGASLTRPKPGKLPPGKAMQRFFLSLSLKPVFRGNELAKLEPVRGSRVGMFIQQMSSKDRKVLIKRMSDVKDKVAVAIGHALKHP